MRYYIYINRDFLRMLFSIEDDSNTLDVEVIEYSVRKSNTSTKGISINPSFEKFDECEKESFKDSEIKKRNRDSNFKKDKIGGEYDCSNSYNIETEKRYINIEDITSMKNNHFYHKLIEMIKDKIKKTNYNRICEEIGYILPYNLNREYDSKNQFIMINQSLVWLDSNNLEGDIELLSKMFCKMHVIGYRMDCMDQNNKKILKAIAIYIE
ncbi:MAG: hypothetical protein RSB67_00410 [Clostridia bacterium]